MDDEMIERCARELSPQSWQAKDTPCDTKAKAKRREASLEYAIKVIKAMREPTENVIQAMNCVHRRDAIAIWQAAIDAVINE